MAVANLQPFTIYHPPPGRVRLSLVVRLLCAAVAFACVSVLGIGARLQPNPAGFGSHSGIGLARCEFLVRTGLPCPSCGMTTSFCWFSRGNFLASFYVQPMGMVLALMTAGCCWLAAYSAITGRPLFRLLMKAIPSQYYLIPLLAFALIGWGWKIFIHLRGIDGWH